MMRIYIMFKSVKRRAQALLEYALLLAMLLGIFSFGVVIVKDPIISIFSVVDSKITSGESSANPSGNPFAPSPSPTVVGCDPATDPAGCPVFLDNLSITSSGGGGLDVCGGSFADDFNRADTTDTGWGTPSAGCLNWVLQPGALGNYTGETRAGINSGMGYLGQSTSIDNTQYLNGTLVAPYHMSYDAWITPRIGGSYGDCSDSGCTDPYWHDGRAGLDLWMGDISTSVLRVEALVGTNQSGSFYGYSDFTVNGGDWSTETGTWGLASSSSTHTTFAVSDCSGPGGACKIHVDIAVTANSVSITENGTLVNGPGTTDITVEGPVWSSHPGSDGQDISSIGGFVNQMARPQWHWGY
jgi:hypothetical protein